MSWVCGPETESELRGEEATVRAKRRDADQHQLYN
jgi:hypothetical protein